MRQGPRRRTHFKRNVANCQGYVLMLSRSRCRMCRHCQATCPDTIVACEKKWMLEESHLQLIQLSKSLLHLFLQNQTPKPKQKQSMCKSKQGRLWLKGTFADCTNLLTVRRKICIPLVNCKAPFAQSIAIAPALQNCKRSCAAQSATETVLGRLWTSWQQK